MISDLKDIDNLSKEMLDLINENEKSIQEEIKNRRNIKIVFMIGAGISRAYGIPTWSELTTDFIDKILSDNLYEESFLKMLKEKNDIKKKFTVAKEILNKYSKKNPTEEYYKFLEKKMLIKTDNKDKNSEEIYNILSKIAIKKGQQKVKFITTNIDNLLEKKMKINSDEIMVGLDGVTAEKEIKLFKIHGDISLLNESLEKCKLVFTPMEYVEFYKENDRLEFLKNIIEDSVLIFLGKEIEEEFGYFLSRIPKEKRKFYIVKGYKSIKEKKRDVENDIKLDINYYKHFNFKILPILNYEFLNNYLEEIILKNIYKMVNLETLKINDTIKILQFNDEKEIEIFLDRIKDKEEKLELNEESYNILKKHLEILENIYLNSKNFISLLKICKSLKKTDKFWKVEFKLDFLQLKELIDSENSINDEKLKFLLKKIKEILKNELAIYKFSKTLNTLLDKLEIPQKRKLMLELSKIKILIENEEYYLYIFFIEKFFKILTFRENLDIMTKIIGKGRIYLCWTGEEEKPNILNHNLKRLFEETRNIFTLEEKFNGLLEYARNCKRISNKNKNITLGYYIYENIDLYKIIEPSEFVDIFKYWGRDLYQFLSYQKEIFKEFMGKINYEEKLKENKYEIFLLGNLLDNKEIKEKYKNYILPTVNYKKFLLEEAKNKIKTLTKKEKINALELEETLRISFLVSIDKLSNEILDLYRKHRYEFSEIIIKLEVKIIELLLIKLSNEEILSLIDNLIKNNYFQINNYYLDSYLIALYEKTFEEKKEFIKRLIEKLIKNIEIIFFNYESSIDETSKGFGGLDILYKYLFEKADNIEEDFKKLYEIDKKLGDYYLGYYYQKLIEKKLNKIYKISREFIIGLVHSGNLRLKLVEDRNFIKVFNKCGFNSLVFDSVVRESFILYLQEKTEDINKIKDSENVLKKILFYNLDLKNLEIKEKVKKILSNFIKKDREKEFLYEEIEIKKFIEFSYNGIFDEKTVKKGMEKLWKRKNLDYISDEEIKNSINYLKEVLERNEEQLIFYILLLLKNTEEYFIKDFENILNELKITKLKFKNIEKISKEVNNEIISILSNNSDKFNTIDLKLYKKRIKEGGVRTIS